MFCGNNNGGSERGEHQQQQQQQQQLTFMFCGNNNSGSERREHRLLLENEAVRRVEAPQQDLEDVPGRQGPRSADRKERLHDDIK